MGGGEGGGDSGNEAGSRALPTGSAGLQGHWPHPRLSKGPPPVPASAGLQWSLMCRGVNRTFWGEAGGRGHRIFPSTKTSRGRPT